MIRGGSTRALPARALLFGLCLVLWAPSLAAQVGPGAGAVQEQQPTVRDPRYRPPQIPEYLQDDESAEDVILSPAGGLDPEKVQRALLKKQERTRRRTDLLREREYYERSRTEAGRRLIERDVLEQFGVERFPYETKGGRHEHHETAGRRFQIVFFLSLPITAAFVGGGIALGKQSRGDASRLTLEESGWALAGGMVFSGMIGWYDNVRWRRFKRKHLEEHGVPEPLSSRGAERMAGLGEIALEPARRDLRMGVHFAF